MLLRFLVLAAAVAASPVNIRKGNAISAPQSRQLPSMQVQQTSFRGLLQDMSSMHMYDYPWRMQVNQNGPSEAPLDTSKPRMMRVTDYSTAGIKISAVIASKTAGHQDLAAFLSCDNNQIQTTGLAPDQAQNDTIVAADQAQTSTVSSASSSATCDWHDCWHAVLDLARTLGADPLQDLCAVVPVDASTAIQVKVENILPQVHRTTVDMGALFRPGKGAVMRVMAFPGDQIEWSDFRSAFLTYEKTWPGTQPFGYSSIWWESTRSPSSASYTAPRTQAGFYNYGIEPNSPYATYRAPGPLTLPSYKDALTPKFAFGQVYTMLIYGVRITYYFPVPSDHAEQLATAKSARDAKAIEKIEREIGSAEFMTGRHIHYFLKRVEDIAHHYTPMGKEACGFIGEVYDQKGIFLARLQVAPSSMDTAPQFPTEPASSSSS